MSSATWGLLFWISTSLLAVLSGAAATDGTQPAYRPKIAIVNEKAFHLEVLAGFMHILAEYGEDVTVFMHPTNFEGRALDFGFLDFLQGFKGQMRALPMIGVPAFDLIIFVSPEYRVHYVQDFINRAQPKAVVFMVHNGDAENVPALLNLHKNTHIVTLSPHVRDYVAERLKVAVDWMLPLKALQVTNPCREGELHVCLSGFAIQGNMDSRRRNYTQIFNQLDVLVNSSMTHKMDKRLQINVVGSGRPERLGVPVHLMNRIIPHRNLRFLDFYNLIAHNFALIPALASDSYYDRKFSSTLITSLVTNTPVIVDQRFLNAYSFLNDSHVARQWKADEVGDVMARILQSPSNDIEKVRKAIGALREEINQRALKQLKAILGKAFGKEQGVQPHWQ